MSAELTTSTIITNECCSSVHSKAVVGVEHIEAVDVVTPSTMSLIGEGSPQTADSPAPTTIAESVDKDQIQIPKLEILEADRESTNEDIAAVIDESTAEIPSGYTDQTQISEKPAQPQASEEPAEPQEFVKEIVNESVINFTSEVDSATPVAVTEQPTVEIPLKAIYEPDSSEKPGEPQEFVKEIVNESVINFTSDVDSATPVAVIEQPTAGIPLKAIYEPDSSEKPGEPQEFVKEIVNESVINFTSDVDSATAAGEQAIADALAIGLSVSSVVTAVTAAVSSKPTSRSPSVIIDAKGKKKILIKKCKTPQIKKSVYENVPKASNAYARTLKTAVVVNRAKTVFESEPSPSAADASARDPPPAKEQHRTVYEKLGAASIAHTGTLMAPITLTNTKTVYESKAQLSKADASTVRPAAHPVQSKTVFENEVAVTKADAGTMIAAALHVQEKTVFENVVVPSKAHAGTMLPSSQRVQDKTVFESIPQPSIAAVSAFSGSEPKPQTKTVFESQPKKSSAHTGTLIDDIPRANEKTVYETKVVHSTAHARWDSQISTQQKRSEFINNPPPSKATTRWDQPVFPPITKTVFENKPQPSRVDASALRDVSDSEYTYETESEDEMEVKENDTMPSADPTSNEDPVEEMPARIAELHNEKTNFVEGSLE